MVSQNNDALSHLSDDWQGQSAFVCYGFGRSSRCEIDYLIDEFDIKYIIDNALPQSKYRGIKIVTWQDYFQLKLTYKIIVLAMSRAETSIKNTLRKSGLKDDADFCDVIRFITEFNYRFRRKIVLNKMTSIVTTCCNLKCKNCVHLIPYLKKNEHIPLEDLENDVSLLFEKVDKIVCFQVVGGETLIYPKLSEYIDWLGKNYVNTGKISLIRIISNGTVIPSTELLDLSQRYPILYEISDYRDQVAIGKRIDEVIRLLDEQGVKHYDNKIMDWLDVGYPYELVNMGDTAEKLSQHMATCHNHCQVLLHDKYYYCVVAGMAMEGNLLQDEMNEYVSVSASTGEELLRYHLGELPYGYLKMCKYCRGFGEDNHYVVRGGIQLSK